MLSSAGSPLETGEPGSGRDSREIRRHRPTLFSPPSGPMVRAEPPWPGPGACRAGETPTSPFLRVMRRSTESFVSAVRRVLITTTVRGQHPWATDGIQLLRRSNAFIINIEISRPPTGDDRGPELELGRTKSMCQ